MWTVFCLCLSNCLSVLLSLSVYVFVSLIVSVSIPHPSRQSVCVCCVWIQLPLSLSPPPPHTHTHSVFLCRTGWSKEVSFVIIYWQNQLDLLIKILYTLCGCSSGLPWHPETCSRWQRDWITQGTAVWGWCQWNAEGRSSLDFLFTRKKIHFSIFSVFVLFYCQSFPVFLNLLLLL